MKIILTLDYELFLNDVTGTVDNCIVTPIKELDKICGKYDIKLTIFVDAAYLYRMSELKDIYPNLRNDYNKTVMNVKWLVERGHDVQLHIHPQWYYSTYDGNEWQLDWDHYKLSDMQEEEAFMKFKASKELLDSIVGYKTILYRAGGYSIQDFKYIECFKKTGIIGDSSVLPDSKMTKKTQSYDYRKVLKTVYKFTNDLCTPVKNGVFWEFPISTCKPVFFLKYLITKRYWMRRTIKNWGDGGNLPHRSKFTKLKSLFSSFRLFVCPHGTIDYQSYFWLRCAYDCSKPFNYMTIIGHPKNFSESSLQYFEQFALECLSNGDNFVTMMQYIKQIENEKNSIY